MRISDWSSDVCSSDLLMSGHSNLIILSAGLFVTVSLLGFIMPTGSQLALMQQREYAGTASALLGSMQFGAGAMITGISGALVHLGGTGLILVMLVCAAVSASICLTVLPRKIDVRSEQHTSRLQSLLPISYVVFCLKKNT